jgi:hypothetical protein
MSAKDTTMGRAAEGDATHRFVDAWNRTERGETFRERHFAFESRRPFACD